MVLEVAILTVKPDLTVEFLSAFKKAQLIIQTIPGYVNHELQKCIEIPNQFLLLVKWEKLEDHTIGFRQSAKYQNWKELLHHFYDPFPTVEHYEMI